MTQDCGGVYLLQLLLIRLGKPGVDVDGWRLLLGLAVGLEMTLLKRSVYLALLLFLQV